MEILRSHPGIDIDGGALVISRDVEGPVIHDVVEIDADTETVRGGDELQQFRLGAVAGANTAPLILAADVEGIPEVVSNGKSAATLGRGR